MGHPSVRGATTLCSMSLRPEGPAFILGSDHGVDEMVDLADDDGLFCDLGDNVKPPKPKPPTASKSSKPMPTPAKPKPMREPVDEGDSSGEEYEGQLGLVKKVLADFHREAQEKIADLHDLELDVAQDNDDDDMGLAVAPGPSSSSAASSSGAGPAPSPAPAPIDPFAPFARYEAHIVRVPGRRISKVVDSSGKVVGEVQPTLIKGRLNCFGLCKNPMHHHRCSRGRSWKVNSGEPASIPEWVLAKWILDGLDATRFGSTEVHMAAGRE